MLNRLRLFFDLIISRNITSESITSIIENIKVKQEEYEIVLRKQDIAEIKNYFTEEDNKKQFIPNGIPFKGEFDHYFDIIKYEEFYGFYRISLLPNNNLEIHCGFAYFNSFLARRYLQITKIFLSKLQEIFPKHHIISECIKNHKNANRYLLHFCFELLSSKNNINYYRLNKARFKKVFC